MFGETTLMDIINRIEIKHFRSFDGGFGQENVEIHDLGDMNIFSGANDSGKSNILRALNLFFNNEISPGIRFDKTRDFSKIASNRFDEEIERKNTEEDLRLTQLKLDTGTEEKRKDLRRSDEVVTIKIWFKNAQRQRGLPETFWISKVYSKRNNFDGEFKYQSELNRAQTTTFLNSFRYEYIPAVKDRQFFNYLFGRLQAYLFEKSDRSTANSFAKSSNTFNELLKDETEQLFNKFLASTGVEASFHIPSTLIDFFRTLSVRTENDVSLFDRGDGIQARFIPEILDEICQIGGRNIIWGFEEPENSYEAKNIRKIKDDFQLRYSRKYQLFITTHTKEFLATKQEYTKQELEIKNNNRLNSKLKDEKIKALRFDHKSSSIALYRVWKTKKNTSLITRFNERGNTWEEICDDLGIIQEARIIDQLQEKIDQQLEQIKNANITQKQKEKIYQSIQDEHLECLHKLKDAESKIEEYQKPILIIEDKYKEIYKLAFLKIKDIHPTKENLDNLFKAHSPFIIRSAESAGSVTGFLSMANTEGYEDKKIIGLYDYDHEGSENFYHLKRRSNGDWDGEILGEKLTGYYRKRKHHPCFYGLMLPIPERLNSITSDIKKGTFTSYVEIENLINLEKLIQKGCVDEKNVMDKTYYKIKDKIKSKCMDKFSDLTIVDFEDFKQLFDKVIELFNS